jgi:uncharacterized protein YutE (UPF0331/DUF86 family)
MNIRDIERKIEVIQDNLEKLALLQALSKEEFLGDWRNIDAALHRLQTSIQALLDMGGYVIASLGLRTPGTSAEIIEVLAEGGIVPAEKVRTFITMCGFRNRIVHLYNHLDYGMLYDILRLELNDITDFLAFLLNVFEKKD